MSNTRYYFDEWYVCDDSETPPVFDKWEKKKRDWMEELMMPRRTAADQLDAECISSPHRFDVSTYTTRTPRFQNEWYQSFVTQILGDVGIHIFDTDEAETSCNDEATVISFNELMGVNDE